MMAILTSPWTPLRVFVVGLVLSGALFLSFAIDSGVQEAEEAPPAPVTVSAEATPPEPTFTPYTVAPDIRNRGAIVSALEAEYPPLLREAGIGGSANVWLFIDDLGAVQEVRIQESSGHQALDDAALRVAAMMEFSPALNRDQAVSVWVAFPITFQVR